MSTSDTPPAGDWVKGADGTPLEIRDADEGDGQVRLEVPDKMPYADDTMSGCTAPRPLGRSDLIIRGDVTFGLGMPCILVVYVS